MLNVGRNLMHVVIWKSNEFFEIQCTKRTKVMNVISTNITPIIQNETQFRRIIINFQRTTA